MKRSTYGPSSSSSSSSSSLSDDPEVQQRMERERQIREQAARKRKQLAQQAQQASLLEQERIQHALEVNKANKAAYVAYLKQQLVDQRREMAASVLARRNNNAPISSGSNENELASQAHSSHSYKQSSQEGIQYPTTTTTTNFTSIRNKNDDVINSKNQIHLSTSKNISSNSTSTSTTTSHTNTNTVKNVITGRQQQQEKFEQFEQEKMVKEEKERYAIQTKQDDLNKRMKNE